MGDAVGGIVTFASDLGPALVGLACALAALLLLLFLCVRTRLRRQQQRQCAPPLLADNVSEAQRSRLLELQFYMRSCMDYRALRLLPHVGAHEESAMALVTTADSDDEPTPRGICANLYDALCGAEPAVYVLTVLPCRNAPLLHDAHALATLHRLLVPPRDSSATRPRPSLRGGRLTAEEAPSHHPRVLRMRSFDFLPASGTAVCVRQWTPAGSLRDMLQGVSPEGEHGRKYFHVGSPLSETKCAAYGYHLLQALRALAPLGSWTAMHAHCGNCFVSPSQTLMLGEWEGAALGLPSPLESFVAALAGVLEPAVAALAHALYEMATGYESDAPRPSVFPPSCSRALLETLQACVPYMHRHTYTYIPMLRCAAFLSPLNTLCAAQYLFRPPSGATLPLTLDDAARLPFFLRAAPRQPGAADAVLPPPDRQERALLQRLGLLPGAEATTNGRPGRHPRRRSRSLTHSYASSAAADLDAEAGGCECTHSGYEAGAQ